MDLIIGAGISGLAFANFTKNDYQVLEAEKEVGGYCRTLKRNGFVWDYSGHFFHFRNPEIKEYICKNIDESHLKNVKKHTQIFYKGQYVDFPFQSNIHQLPKDEFIDCLYDLFMADSQKPSKTFKEFIYNNLGKSISEKFLVPYNEKLYAVDLNKLDANAMGRFFPKVDKLSVIKNFKEVSNPSYNDTFTYPTGGAIEYINSLMVNIPKGKVCVDSEVVKIDVENKFVVTSNNSIFNYDNLVSTMPIPKLLELCSVPYDKKLYTSNKVLVYNLGFDRGSDDRINSWIYFPDRSLSFYRVGYYNNILGQERMSLYVEIGLSKETLIADQNLSLERVLSDLKRVGIVRDHRLVDYQKIVMDPAYVHINTLQKEDIERKKEILRNYNVYSIGRYGAWTYCSIEDNIIEARDLAKSINKIG